MSEPLLPTLSDLAAPEALRVERACTQFEGAWKEWRAGQPRPTFESWLKEPEGPPRMVLLAELLRLELAYRRLAGEQPELAEYLPRFPQDEPVLRVVFAKPMGEARETVSYHDSQATRSYKPAAGVSRSVPPPLPTSMRLPAVPGYEVLGELGRGGMGVVYQARQLKANRLVALKLILAGVQADEAELARFRTEAEALARLQHPHIVQIFEVGEYDGRPFFTLEYCPGGSLDRKLNNTPLPPKAAAALVGTLARAVHAAHQKGVVHRDLKPANVLLAEDGAMKITDFGLAKKLGEAGQTDSNAVMGTPSYMAPEQASGRSKEIGPAADVYALGAILYECLTGRPPFRAATVMDTLLQVVADEPVPPTRLNRNTPRDLETICLKCLRKEAASRYPSAAALAEDLTRFQAGEPIRARPVGTWERVVKWVKRRPGVTGSLAAVVLMALTTVLSIMWAYRQVPADTLRANERAEDFRRAEAYSWYALADKAAAEQNDDVWKYMSEVPEDLRGFEWRFRARLYGLGNELQGDIGTNTPYVVYSPDSRRLARCGEKGMGIWDVDTCQQLHKLTGHTMRVASISFGPDGRRLASASDDGTIRVWDTSNGQTLLELKGHSGGVTHVVFSPDGRRLASASMDATLRVWDAGNGDELFKFTAVAKKEWFYALVFSSDGSKLAALADSNWAALADDGLLYVWNANNGQSLLKREVRQIGRKVLFSPDGRRVASDAGRYSVLIWDVDTATELKELRPRDGVVDNELRDWAFSPNGRFVATASVNIGKIKIWNANTGDLLRELTLRELKHKQVNLVPTVEGLAFSKDGRLASVDSGLRVIRIWNAGDGRELALIHSPRQISGQWAFSPNGRTLAAGSTVWNVKEPEIRLEHNPTCEPIFSPDSRRLACALSNDVTREHTVRIWDADNGEEQLRLKGHSDGIHKVDFSPDGRRLASASSDTVRIWDAVTGQQVRMMDVAVDNVDRPVILAFKPDGRRLLSVSFSGMLRIWDADSGRPLLQKRLGNVETNGGIVFRGASISSLSLDTSRLATAEINFGTVHVWDTNSGQQLLEFYPCDNRQVFDLALSPDGRRLATSGRAPGATDPGTMNLPIVQIWDAETGRLLVTVKTIRNRENWESLSLKFSSDGRLVGGSYVWDARTGQQLLESFPWTVISPDGRRGARIDGAVLKVW